MKGDLERNWMNGLDGNDQLNDGAGDDSFYGSVRADSFKCGTGNDRIDDFSPSEGDTKSNDCENIGYSNHTGVSNETLTGFPANHTLRANNSSSQ
jgi:hypothetical protein